MLIVVLALCLAAVIVATASAALLPHRTYGAGDDGQTVSIKKGEALRLSLPENPSTGYSWNLTLSNGLYLVGDEYSSDDTSGRLVGAGGTHSWDIRATGIGPQQILGVYRRPWESTTAPEKTFALTVQVSGGGGLTVPGNSSWNLPRMFKLSAVSSKFPPTMKIAN